MRHPFKLSHLLFQVSLLMVTGVLGITIGMQAVFSAPIAPDARKTLTVATRSAPASLWLQVSLRNRQATLFSDNQAIRKYRIGVGRPGWETPVGTFQISQMQYNPTWISPFTNEVISGGSPRNPMRHYWIGFWQNGNTWVGFHGTLDPSTVGRAASHGCLHMTDRDLQDLFSRVHLGMQVRVIP
ncbi:MAG: L,D-transpeptidase [Leptolyngbyaceae cyanobacterium bins.59]|nr:L,D-transpeptidase [Leptolyngbyaceae cyanobacterium bins.59]